MKFIVKYLIILVLILIALLAGIYWGGRMQFFNEKPRESSTVMLERIQKVFKLVTLEAQVSEIYNYEDYRRWDIAPLRKRALLRVNARVSIGYDFDRLELEMDEESRTVTIKAFPEPEILSIDHDVDYFDIEEGLFNSFSGSDLTRLNARAKDYALDMVQETEVYRQADEQRDEIMELLKELFSTTGWKLEMGQGNGRLSG